ncbi:Wzz/FepE/Etk N-terminal domain-containing protein [Aureimonas populi]|uniref:Wzz/FepE/Etk N-terminal domain-containing protein n=1 Tax=Aureimonas populi TaxID=1701758 RepID=A0ABW5CTZ3_9HYPH|nr:Wzz/FepE/Etk N-terminal domain-containing protein [Aureimonas populi]
MNTARFSQRRFYALDGSKTGSGETFDLERLWTIVRRNLRLVGLCVLAAVVVGVLYVRASPAVYASQARILLDESIGTVARDFASVGSNIQLDNRIASQIEVLRSSRLALEVVDELNLGEDEVFLSPPPSPLASLTRPLRAVAAMVRGPQEAPTGVSGDAGAAPSAVPVDPEEARRQQIREAAARSVQQNLSVQRVERSSVISLTYQSHDPALAYRVANAYAAAFLQEQRLAVAEASVQATGWMQTRLAELGEQQRAASLAVEEFRARNNLSMAQGEFTSEQRLANLTGQLASGQAEVAQAQARAEQLQAVLSAGDATAIASAALASADIQDPVVQQLQARYAEMSGRIAQITADFGASHPQVVRLTRERETVSAQLVGELQRLSSRYTNEYEVVRNRQAALENAVSQQTGLNAEAGGALVELRELEQQAATLNTIYGNFLARYEEAMQRESFPLSNFRIISSPTEPERPTGPRFLRTVAIFAFLGVVMGGAAGTLREFNERSYRIGAEVTEDLGVRFFGYLATLPGQKRWWPAFLNRWAPRPEAQGSGPKPTFGYDETQAISAETLRNVAHGFAGLTVPGRASRIIGVVSALPGEGKTTVAMGLARLLSRIGSRVIVLDADFRRPALNGFLPQPISEGGLAEAIRTGDWRSQVKNDEDGVCLLPIPDDRHAALGSTLLSSSAMSALLAELAESFDYVILDLPPAGLVVDAKVAAPLVDGLLLVIRWGKTARTVLRGLLADEPEVGLRVTGAVLNATDLSRLRRYGERGSRERVYKDYASYYRGA